MYNYKLVQTDALSLKECSNLLSLVFPATNKFTDEFIEWQYHKNPNGSIVGFNAYCDDVLAAHYVTQPMFAFVNGKKTKGLLSLNTATHPEHRGKGLFTKLAVLTYEFAKNNGYKFVYGVANDNSTHGFINKLDFQLVSPLKTKIVFGKIIHKQVLIDYEFKRSWTQEDLKWRLSNPSLKYYLHKNQITVPTGKLGVNAIMHHYTDRFNMNTLIENLKALNLIKLYVGIDNSIDFKKSFYFNVPKRFKSSPLNLIFKDLTSKRIKLDPKKIKFELIDFDGY